MFFTTLAAPCIVTSSEMWDIVCPGKPKVLK